MSDVISKRIETWESVLQMSIDLAEMIESAAQADPAIRFDKLLVIPRGGYYPANIVGRLLNFASTDIIHASVASYATGATTSEQFKVRQLPNERDVKDQRILIIEEVCDSGATLDYVTKYLIKHNAGMVKSAVLHYKPGKSTTGYVPDWFIVKTDEWVVYPWEEYEERGKSSIVRSSSKSVQS